MNRNATWQLTKCVFCMVNIITEAAIVNTFSMEPASSDNIPIRTILLVCLIACCTLFLQSLKKYLKS